MTRMAKGVPYRKYRPNLTEYKGHYKEWWEFSYKAVLENDVRRKRRNWDWNEIKRHRDLCKEYAKLYQTKLQSKKVPREVEARILECEKQLDAFNIIIIRQRVELEVTRFEKLHEKEKSSWFGGWWGGKRAEETKPLSEAAAIGKISKIVHVDVGKDGSVHVFRVYVSKFVFKVLAMQK